MGGWKNGEKKKVLVAENRGRRDRDFTERIDAMCGSGQQDETDIIENYDALIVRR